MSSVKVGETTIDASEYNVVYSDNTPAGTATVSITDKAGGDYIVYGSKTFTINKANISPSVSIADWEYGANASTPSVTGNTDDGAVTYHYKVTDADDGTYTTIVPTNVGSYTIRATIAATSNCNGGTATTTFSITQKSIGSGAAPAPGITIDIVKKSDDSFTTTVKNNGQNMTVGTEGNAYDYSIASSGSASSKYYEVTITGANNYTGSAKARFANLTFGTHDNTNYSATFVTNSTGDGDFATPTGMTAYIVTAISGNAVTATPLDYIPENVPVLLLTEDATANGFVVKAKGEEPDAVTTGNMLAVDANAKSLTTAEVYLLYKGEFVLNKAGTLPAGRVYLEKPTGVSPARLGIVWGESTDIDDTFLSPLTPHPSGWYTLDGRRLSGKPTKKGLYLRDGQKMVVR